MIYLRYLRENTAKIRENKRKLAINTVRSADFQFCVPTVQESVPGNVKGGRDSHEYCTPHTGSVFVVCSSTGV